MKLDDYTEEFSLTLSNTLHIHCSLTQDVHEITVNYPERPEAEYLDITPNKFVRVYKYPNHPIKVFPKYHIEK